VAQSAPIPEYWTQQMPMLVEQRKEIPGVSRSTFAVCFYQKIHVLPTLSAACGHGPSSLAGAAGEHPHARLASQAF
jgi:hypothetical protein